MTTRQAREEQFEMRAKTCTPCTGGIPPLTPQEALALRAHIPEWELRDEARRIERSLRFRDFREALSFVARVGELAEAEGHHPDVRFGWGYATVSLQTKKIDGLHDNDFIVAAKIDHILKEPDERLDQAIAMTFPASDPIAVGRPTGIEQDPRSHGKTGKAVRARKT
jgi:4a-hydroxytetrahydrobiopterin dehydratase